jgi:hypothetical protein
MTVAEWSRRTYPAPLGAGGVGSIPANSDALNVPSYRRWLFEMKLSPLYNFWEHIANNRPANSVRRLEESRLLDFFPAALAYWQRFVFQVAMYFDSWTVQIGTVNRK